MKYVLLEWVGKWVMCNPDPGHSPTIFDTPEEALNFAQKEFSDRTREDDMHPGDVVCDLWMYEYMQERFGFVYPEGTVLVWPKYRFRAASVELPPDLVQDDAGQWVETPF